MSDYNIEEKCNSSNMLSPASVKSGLSFGLAPAELSSNIVGLITNGQDRNGSTLTSPISSPSVTATPVRDQTKSSMSTGSSSSSKDPSRHKDGHSSSSGHRSSSSSSKPNGSSSHSKDHKHSSHSSSSSRPKDASTSLSKDADKHRVSSSSSTPKDKDHSKSKDQHSSSHSKSHSSSSTSADRSKVDGSSSSSSSRPKEDSSHKQKHSSSSSNSHKPSDDKDRHHSSKSHSEKKPHSEKTHEKTEHKGSSASAVKQSASLEIGSNVSVKVDGGSIKVKIEKSPTKQHDQIPMIKTELIKTEPTSISSPVKAVPSAGYNSDDEDEVPLSERVVVKTEKRKRVDSDDDSDTPLSVRKNKKIKKEVDAKKRKIEDNDFKDKKPVKVVKTEEVSGQKRGKKTKPDEEEHNWKWWEEEKKEEGVKWKTLEHKGPVFAAPYEPVPDNIHFYYDGKVMKLSELAEEVAGFYARMLDHDYTTRELFNNNFFKDWRKVMTKDERLVITNLAKCNFREYYNYFKMKTEERKSRSKAEKLALKKENEEMQKLYGFCVIDGHKQKIGNYKIEPPGLFRGRGDHPKQGMLKQRVMPEDVLINCSKDSKVPSPPPGHKWKEVRHDNTVTWLASWTESVQGQTKYVMLNASSKLKGEKDYNKYEMARKLKKRINKIRETYKEDWKSKEMRIRQRAVALYFIDKLALRAGNEKDEDTADTVGCCSLRVEHIKLHETYEDKECVVEFDFLGKDSIRYYNRISVERRVFKNLQLFMENKQGGDDLFDRLNTSILNKHLQTLMDGLTAKVFRTYNASHTLQEQLSQLSKAEGFEDESVATKLLAYNRANRAVAILCNHQRAVPKNFDKQMENLQSKIDAKMEQVKAAKKELKDAKTDAKHSKSAASKDLITKKKKALERLQEQLSKLEVQATDKDENKEIALGTSKLNYLDPRISIAWCKKWSVPVEKIFNKTQREKFAWAIDMATEDYVF